jgi:hypothetical protein
MYYNGRCRTQYDGHVSAFTDVLERVVVSMIARAYSPATLRRAAADVAEHVSNNRTQLAHLDARIGRVRSEQLALGQLELEAKVGQRDDDLVHYQELRRVSQGERVRLEKEREVVQAALSGTLEDDKVRRSLNIVRDASRTIEALFRLADTSPAASRALVGILTRRILLTKPGEGLALIRIEFPNDAVAEELVITAPVSCTQPQRAIAHYRFSRGDPAEQIARDLRYPSVDSRAPRQIRPALVSTLALQHAHFEPVPRRVGPGEPAPAIADRLKVDADAVHHAMLAGLLGPVTLLTDGTPTLLPTEPELAHAFLEYGRRTAAASNGWRPEETLLYGEVSVRYGVHERVLHRWRPSNRVIASDAAGRRYLRERDLPAHIVGDGPRTDADQAAAYRAAATAAVVAAGYPAESAGDFVPFRPLMLELRRRCGGPSTALFYRAVMDGRIAAVEYSGPPEPGAIQAQPTLVYCPRAVRDTHVKAAVLAWIGGAHQLARRSDTTDAVPPTDGLRRRRGRWRKAGDASDADEQGDGGDGGEAEASG